MARPVEIDRATTLKVATQVFWRQGYTATSMNQLLRAMNIGSGSFYAAFDSKAELFKRVVDAYGRWSEKQWAQMRARHQGLDVIRVFLEKTLINVKLSDRQKGCLLVNSVLELADVEDELYQHARNALGTLESEIRACVEEARELGALNTRVTDDALVGLLMSQIHGLRVESRLGLTKNKARQRVSALLELVSTT